MKHEYRAGKEARDNFERTMKALFRVRKDAAKKTEKQTPKKKAGKD
jgi:hypothetical protein